MDTCANAQVVIVAETVPKKARLRISHSIKTLRINYVSRLSLTLAELKFFCKRSSRLRECQPYIKSEIHSCEGVGNVETS